MSRFICCEKCGGLKEMKTANYPWSWGFCDCPDEEIERDIEEAVQEVRFWGRLGDIIVYMPQAEAKKMIEEYADYARQEIRFCPYCGAALGIV